MDTKQIDKDKSPSQPAVEDSEEEENEILEESPCGRWLKRREEVEQSNIPGIDATYLAMDTEEGVEVVWNEVRFSERKYFKAKEELISEVFDRLIQLEHANIVKLHKYWIHKDADMPRVIFITEYMSSGSLKQFLKKTKRHDIKMALQAWRRWCTQTLSALCYLHSSQPSIVHGNINCDTIFISYNGLIKIGAIAPDAIHRHVKTVRGDSKSNLHFIAPEIGSDLDCPVLSPAVDIYSFGMCALEMAALEISTDDDSSHHITDDVIQKTIDSLENLQQKDFIQRCLQKDPSKRPSARDLLFHPIIFEVPSLRLYSAHSILNNPSLQPEQLTEEAISRFLCLRNQSDRIVVEIKHNEKPTNIYKQSDFPNHELEKFLDEVKNGACPLTAIKTTTRPPLISRQRTISPELIDEAHKLINTPDNPYDEETRRILHINCCIQPLTLDVISYDVKIVIKLDDKINRQLTCEIVQEQFIPSTLAQELVYYGFVNQDDKENVINILLETLNESQLHPSHAACCEKALQFQKPCISSIPNPSQIQPPQVLLPQTNIVLSNDPAINLQNVSTNTPNDENIEIPQFPIIEVANSIQSTTIPEESFIKTNLKDGLGHLNCEVEQKLIEINAATLHHQLNDHLTTDNPQHHHLHGYNVSEQFSSEQQSNQNQDAQQSQQQNHLEQTGQFLPEDGTLSQMSNAKVMSSDILNSTVLNQTEHKLN